GVGTLAMIYLLYIWIILPIMHMQRGLARMAAHEFSARLPVESNDEFGALALGFNHMADELQGLYGDLEARVEQKTRELELQNRELTTLYDMTSFLNQPCDVESMCRGFLKRVMERFDADGGSIRTLDPSGEKLHIVVSEGLPVDLEESEHCMDVQACLCGQAVGQGVVVIHDFRKTQPSRELGCAKAGFRAL
ncbi:HAMP domain-containing protein, partial [Burkholderiaceae bacterium DAT-1]|nr:HAMP domain-containing protein [Burkholderiaceae bacterium DAT-1]